MADGLQWTISELTSRWQVRQSGLARLILILFLEGHSLDPYKLAFLELFS